MFKSKFSLKEVFRDGFLENEKASKKRYLAYVLNEPKMNS